MKIVNLEQFRKYPSGTLYSKYEPCVFNGLMIKCDTLLHDFVYQDLIGNVKAHDSGEYANKLESALETGESLELDFDFAGRDGLFEDDQLFAVYEENDVKQLIDRITNETKH